MDAVKKSNRQAKWKELILAQETSGLSQTEFCRQHNLNLPQFNYYLRVIKSEHHPDENASNSIDQLFSSVKIKKSESNISSEIKIILPNGFQCVVLSVMDVSQIKRLMEALISC